MPSPRFALPPYAELHCQSNFSFLIGASHPEELVERAIQLGYSALALTDECSLAGVVRAHAEIKRHAQRPLHLIIGSEMRVSPSASASAPLGLPAMQDDEALPHSLTEMRLVLLAQTRRGYGNLSHWITLARRRAEKGSYLAHPGDVEGKAPDGPMLAGLPDCLALLVAQGAQSFDQVFAQAMWLKTWFQDRAAIALELHHGPDDDSLLETVQRVSTYTGLPIVATGGVLMHVRSRKPLQDMLTATRLRRTVAEAGWQLQPNAEAHLRSRGRLAAFYPDEWLERSLTLAGRCSFSLDQLRYEYPQEIVPAGETPSSYLRKLTYGGMPWRYPFGAPAKVIEQIEHELVLITRLDYERYFLTVADIVRWARAQNILCQGRGSAANSAVCYCLGITEIDPDRATLLFERFISAERKEPPDIDVDFEHQRREEVIQYIYRKYGRHRAALTAVVICYRPRSALRDVGRALGIDLQRIEAVAKSLHWFDGRAINDERLRENGFDPAAPLCRLWMDMTQQLIGFPRHLSQHPGGFVIAREQLSHLVPVENAAMDKRSVIQWEKDDLESLGLMKVDILALGMLSALRRSLEFIGHKLGREFQLQDIPDKDSATFDMICKADTVGVFQIESRAQMSMLPRLKPREYYDLVVQVAIVRPGPIQGGMVHPYLKNRGLPLDQVDYPGPEIKEALMRTQGVPIFQEQVMQIAILAADFTPGEADQLRRAMAAWKRKGGLGPFHEKLVGRMVRKGYAQDYAERIFKQIQGFGEYGFPESHAAGFALLAYDSSWIKRHHPDAFLASLLNSQPMGFYAPAQLVRDAREHGVQVEAVDVMRSDWQTTLEPRPVRANVDTHDGPGPNANANANAEVEVEVETGASENTIAFAAPSAVHAPLQPVRLGLHLISGLAPEAAQRIVHARLKRLFSSIDDLARRAELSAQDLSALAHANALQALSGHRHQASWAVAGIDTRPTALLRSARVQETDAQLQAPAEVEDTLADYRSVGLTLQRHPLALLRERLNGFKVQTAAAFRTYPHGRLARASGLVTHRQRPQTAKGTMFVTLEDETGTINVVVWPRVVESQRKPLLAARLMTVYGQWQRQGDNEHAVMHLVAVKIIDHSGLLNGLNNPSRDFK